MIIVLSGVAGSGKSTVGVLLARALGWAYLEGDDFHPAANVAKMRRGIPLTDDDRFPWLDALSSAMAEQARKGRSAVAACSALKYAYRERLRASCGELAFVQLSLPAEQVRSRLLARKGHFAGADLLESQFRILEPLSADEGIILDAGPEPATLVADLRRQLGI